MRVLVGCEFSGVVRDAFAGFGHDAWSCDLLETERPGQHIVGSVLDHLNENWDLAVLHPPCTYLTNAGVRWLYMGGRGTVIDDARWALKELHKMLGVTPQSVEGREVVPQELPHRGRTILAIGPRR